jgi:opacity protein-like surface antigen
VPAGEDATCHSIAIHRVAHPRNPARLGVSLLLLILMRSSRLCAQAPPPFGPTGPDFLSRTAPAPPFTPSSVSRYNLKVGNLTARLSGSVQTEFNDNINLSQSNPRADLSIAPDLGIGFMWPLNKENVLHLDLDGGYRWYLNSPSLNSIAISPRSTLEHDVHIGRVHINLHDNFGVQVDPVSLGSISGGTNAVVNYQRFSNTSGLNTDWRPYRDLAFNAGFDYTYDRSLNRDFTSLDQDGYAFHAGTEYNLSPRWTAGIVGNYTLSRYVQHIQNDGTSYGLGPSLTYRPTPHLTVNLSAGYTVATFQPTGTILDTTSFHGATYTAIITHTLNSRSSQDLRVSHTPSQGIGSNFTEATDVQYGFQTQVRKTITLHAMVAYEHLRASLAGGETADRYLTYLGASYHFSRHWLLGLGYSFALKDSDLAEQSYTQNRLTLDLTRQF